jgi:hypothetical protein
VGTTPTVKKVIRTAWETAVKGRTGIDPEAEAKRLAEIMLRNEQFVRRFAEEHVYQEVLASGMRLCNRTPGLCTVGGRRVTREQLIAEVKEEVRSRYADWMVFDPTKRAHVHLLRMTRPQLLAAARHETEIGIASLKAGNWLRLIGERLTDGQTVADVWTDDELAHLMESIDVRSTASLTQPAAADAVVA